MTLRPGRRDVLRAGAAATIAVIGGSWLTGCGSEAPQGTGDPAPSASPAASTGAGSRILRGEDVGQAGDAVASWLQRVGLG